MTPRTSGYNLRLPRKLKKAFKRAAHLHDTFGADPKATYKERIIALYEKWRTVGRWMLFEDLHLNQGKIKRHGPHKSFFAV